jgi:hypothetical protein
MPQRGGVELQIVTHPDDDRLSRVETDPHVEVHAVRAAQLVGVGADVPGHVPGRVAGAAGVVLEGEGSAEEGHDPVTGELVDGTAEAANPVGEDVDEAVDDPRPGLDIEVLLQLHRALNVGEQDGELLAFPLRLAGPGQQPRTRQSRRDNAQRRE